MENTLGLLPGQVYTVVKVFADYDKIIHPEGETWTYLGTRFLPYDDGLTLHVLKEGHPMTYRLQWRSDQQAFIIENFREFVAAAK